MKCQLASVLSRLLAVSSAQARESSKYVVARPVRPAVVQSRAESSTHRVSKHVLSKLSKQEAGAMAMDLR